MTLTRHLSDDVALRVDDDQRRPGTSRVRIPRHQVGIIEHRVMDGVPLDGGLDGFRSPFVFELGRVHADDHQRVGELLLERTQFVQDVQAVHATEGPEVQNDDSAAQTAE